MENYQNNVEELMQLFTENVFYNSKINEEKMLLKSLKGQCSCDVKHSKRVRKYASKLANVLNIDKETKKDIKLASVLHDIGKIAISEQILNSPRKLTVEEFEIVKQHSKIGYQLLLATHRFKKISKYVLEHHEHYDGSGYPIGLAGKDISLPARIITIADSYDAMTSKRAYKKTLTKQEAIEELRRCSNKQFDPELVEIFIKKVLNYHLT